MFQMVYKALLLSLKIKRSYLSRFKHWYRINCCNLQCCDRIFKKDSELIDYRIDSVTEGTDAQAEVHVELVIENQHVNGIGIDHDILQASCKAYVEAHAKYIAQDLEKVGNK